MILPVLSIVICTLLVVKLLFFTDQHREQSRFFHRAVLFLAAAYAGKQVIWLIYYPEQMASVWLLLMHTVLLIGLCYFKPCHLPWNNCR